MAKKVSKWFRIGVEGDTCDGRNIEACDIQHMAASFDPRVYGCRINLEHIRGLLPTGDFKRLGDATELKTEQINDDSALNGKWALFAKISPTDELAAMVKAGQKIYTSMEIRPNFANTGKAYLVGLAVTDDPASLGTEMLEFSARATVNPFAGKKDQPEDLFSVATLAVLEFEDLPDTLLSNLTDKIKGMFSAKQTGDDARFSDVQEAITVVAGELQAADAHTAQRFTALEQQMATLKADQTASASAFTHLKTSLDNTESYSQPRRPLSPGGNGDSANMTNC
ncbi:MAG: GPO family capsid scaffolding protein [Ewingella sp.]